MITLDVADLVVIGGRILGIGSDAALSQIDVDAAHSALTEAGLTGSVIAGQDTAAAAGIGLMHALLRHRPFPRHGEQVAVASGLQFLSLNGWRADLDPPAAAAVVVEALACGQLSPVSAAAWLSPRLAVSPRLTAQAPARSARCPRPVSVAMPASPAWLRRRKAGMRDTSAPSRQPSHPARENGRRKPPSVIYSQVLLFVQAGFWALGMAAGLTLSAAELVHSGGPATLLALGWAAITGGLAAVKLMLGLRVDRGRSKRTWWTIIATELAMTGFGVLWLALPVYEFVLLGFSGAALSLASVLCLVRPRARQHFTSPDAVPGVPGPDARSDSASSWQLALTSRRLAII